MTNQQKNTPFKILSNFINPISKDSVDFLDNYILEVNAQNTIISLKSFTRNTLLDDSIIDMRDKIITPGLIDAHTHIPQLPIVKKYGHTLLNWLNTHTFPAEIKFKNLEYAETIIRKFFDKQKKFGTTTSAIYTTIHPESTDLAFKIATEYDHRVIMGKMMMDQECPQELAEVTLQSLRESQILQEKWHKPKDKTYYAYSPRFAITCSAGLMAETARIAKQTETYIQTHINENLIEKDYVKKLYPDNQNYLDVYDQAGLLGPKTLLGHAIHCTKAEIDRIKDTNSKVIHCPDANFFLKSGRFKLELFEEAGITVGLGSDVGAGTTLNMFHIMKSMIYMQSAKKEAEISIPKAFYYATLGNAKALSLDREIGNFRVGKTAELITLNIDPRKLKASKSIDRVSEALSLPIFNNRIYVNSNFNSYTTT